jgi:hypothetical protein
MIEPYSSFDLIKALYKTIRLSTEKKFYVFTNKPYFEYYLSYEEEKDLNTKITNSLKITGVINQIFKPNLVSKYTRIKIYKILARPTLAYGSESWTIQSNDRKILISGEMGFIRRTLAYTLFDHK